MLFLGQTQILCQTQTCSFGNIGIIQSCHLASHVSGPLPAGAGGGDGGDGVCSGAGPSEGGLRYTHVFNNFHRKTVQT